MRSGVYPNLASRFDFWPVETAEGQHAVIGLAFDPDERPSAPDVLVNIVVRVLALVLDRQHGRIGPLAPIMLPRSISSEEARCERRGSPPVS